MFTSIAVDTQNGRLLESPSIHGWWGGGGLGLQDSERERKEREPYRGRARQREGTPWVWWHFCI